jgi:glycosyltransferase involved in cell wall biosynthesis
LNNNHIITVHDLLPIDQEHLFPKHFVQYYKLVLPILLKKSLHIFSVSNFTKSRLIENYNINPDKISIVYNGTIFDIKNTYDNTEYDFLILENQLVNKKYFIVVGNLGFHKNNIKLIQAWKKTNIDACLIFIGKLPYHFKNIFYKEVYSDNRILHFENIKDETLALFYKNAISLIFISLYEGFGIPLIEANALGCPVIYSQNTVLQEISGNCNIPVNPFCEESIIETLNATFDMRKQPIDFYISNSNNYSWANESMKVENTLMNFL